MKDNLLTPYYQENGITIYHGDCREILPSLPKVDLVLTDPPYGIGKAEWDVDFPTWWLDDAALISNTVAVMPGTWNLLTLPRSVGRLTYKWTLSAHLVNGMTRGGVGFGNWIPCVIYKPRHLEAVEWCASFADWCKSSGITKGDLDVAAGTSDMGGWWSSRLPHRCVLPSFHQWEKLKRAFAPPDQFNDLIQSADYEPQTDCKQFVVGRDVKPDHPSPKPLNVVTWFLSTLGGVSVLDPFMGSGTTLRAAKDLERKAIGIEIEERYCEIAAKRLSQGVFSFTQDTKSGASPAFSIDAQKGFFAS